MTVSGHLTWCDHGYCETEHCRTCEIMGVCKLCDAQEKLFLDRMERGFEDAYNDALDGMIEGVKRLGQRYMEVLEARDRARRGKGVNADLARRKVSE